MTSFFAALWMFIIVMAGCISGSAAFAAPPDVDFTVSMSEAVAVTGCPTNCPRIAVDVGGVNRYADYSAGTGSSSLTFSYAPVSGDVDLDGVTLTSPIDLNGGTITDLNGNAISPLTYTVPDTSGVKIDYPSLSMDFAADTDGRYTLEGTVYNDLTSFLGATGGTYARNSMATYFDSTGTLQTAAANQPRFDHDPVTHVLKGILIEESRTNLIRQSSAFTTSPWFHVGSGMTTSSSTTAPDGSTVPFYTFPSTEALYQDVAVTPGQNASHSIWIKANQVTTIGFRNPGSLASCATNTSFVVSTSWQRITLTATSTQTSSRLLIDNRSSCGYGTAAGLNLAFFGAQIEIGSFPTSHIPTTAATVTRAADSLTLPTGAWFSASEGTSMVWTKASPLASNLMRFLNMGSLGSNRMLLQKNTASGVRLLSQVSGVTVAAPSTTATFSGGDIKIVGSYQSNNYGISINGGAAVTALSGAVPAVTSFDIGSQSPDIINTNLTAFKYYPIRASNTQLQLMTQ
ncbi:MAG: hypothetical protein AUJ12_02320 [Alphaproteobacteria bacterium CG1_02_46_17]|nr:MAG: hypothetical protein AUJ12_02320 [Alphaproteobacteria bacterium CG1_02_46_17]